MPLAVGALLANQKKHKKEKRKYRSARHSHVLQFELEDRLKKDGQPVYPPWAAKVVEVCTRIELSKEFNVFIVFVIIVAGVLAGISTYDSMSSGKRGRIIAALDLVILVIFAIEAAIKLAAQGKRPYKYFRDLWNLFDFSIVILSFVGNFAPSLSFDFAVLRVIRLLRVLKLLTALAKLRVLVTSLLSSFREIGYVFLLLALLFYLYSVLGCVLFSNNDVFHFRNLHHSLLSLYRASTFEDWTDIMYINMYGCDKYGYERAPTRLSGSPAPRFLECGEATEAPIVSALYFCSFSLLATMVLFNLFIGVILTNIEKAQCNIEEEKYKYKQNIRHTVDFIDFSKEEVKSEVSQRWKKLQRIVTSGMWRSHFNLNTARLFKVTHFEAEMLLAKNIALLDEATKKNLELFGRVDSFRRSHFSRRKGAFLDKSSKSRGKSQVWLWRSLQPTKASPKVVFVSEESLTVDPPSDYDVVGKLVQQETRMEQQTDTDRSPTKINPTDLEQS